MTLSLSPPTPTMIRRHRFATTILFALVIAAIAAGCAGGTARQRPLALSAYVARSVEEQGFRLSGSPAMFANLAQFDAASAGDPAAESSAARLRAAGFRRAISQPTESPAGEGVTTVIELASARTARALLRSSYSRTPPVPGSDPKFHRFSVPGVPGAVATSLRTPSGVHAANVFFREGRCVIVVGDAVSGENYERPPAAGAAAIYGRTSGRSGACTA